MPTVLAEAPFIGRESFIPKADEMPDRFELTSSDDVRDWIDKTRLEPEWDDTLPATFIVDLAGALWIADRRSEHVACARMTPVLAAGVIFFEQRKGKVHVARVTN